jgi:hypothetical protein
VGSKYGEFTGPVTGNFSEWVTCYKCRVTTQNEALIPNADALSIRNAEAINSRNDNAVSARDDESTPRAIPCGNTLTASGGQHSLTETRKDNVFQFAVNGIVYVPVEFFVTHGCTCRFYT